MPKYTFLCSSCGTSEQKYVPRLVMDIPCPICNRTALRQMPELNGPSSVTEVIDKYTGITHRRDQKEEVKERQEEYYWTVEVPRFVASGVYSIDTMLENGWIWIDDNNTINIYKVPPHRR